MQGRAPPKSLGSLCMYCIVLMHHGTEEGSIKIAKDTKAAWQSRDMQVILKKRERQAGAYDKPLARPPLRSLEPTTAQKSRYGWGTEEACYKQQWVRRDSSTQAKRAADTAPSPPSLTLSLSLPPSPPSLSKTQCMFRELSPPRNLQRGGLDDKQDPPQLHTFTTPPTLCAAGAAAGTVP